MRFNSSAFFSYAMMVAVATACSGGGQQLSAPISAQPVAPTTEPTAAPTASPTATASGSIEATATATPSAKATSTATAHATATPTARPSSTPAPTATPHPTPTATPKTGATPAFNDWTTYGFDNARDGYNPNTSALTPASIAKFHLVWESHTPSYNTQTQPVLATNIGAHTGLLMVGGATGEEYAFDALSGASAWTTNLGSATIACRGGGSYSLGIGGTAVYDPSSQVAYVSNNKNDGTADAPTYLYINQLNVATGKLLNRVDFTPTHLAGETNTTYTSLALANGLIYAGTGSDCDVSSWRGRVSAVRVPAMQRAATFYTAWNQHAAGTPAPLSGAGIWGWGGVALDPSGNVWTATGNVDTASGTAGPQAPFVQSSQEYAGLGEHVLQLTPDLSTLLQSNYPGFTFGRSSVDLDISGSPVIGQPLGCHPAVAVQGKSGFLYLYDATNATAGPATSYKFTTSSYADPNLGNPGFSPLTGTYYANVGSAVSGGITPAPGMVAIKPCNSTSSVVWSTDFGPDSQTSGSPRSMPTVTAGGVIFVGVPCERDGKGGCTGTSGNYGGALYALDIKTGTLLNRGVPLITTPAQIRMGAVADGDWLYLIDNNGHFYGLTIDPKFPAIPDKFVRVKQLEQKTYWHA